MAWHWSVKSVEGVVLNALPKEFQKEIGQKAWREEVFCSLEEGMASPGSLSSSWDTSRICVIQKMPLNRILIPVHVSRTGTFPCNSPGSVLCLPPVILIQIGLGRFNENLYKAWNNLV